MLITTQHQDIYKKPTSLKPTFDLACFLIHLFYLFDPHLDGHLVELVAFLVVAVVKEIDFVHFVHFVDSVDSVGSVDSVHLALVLLVVVVVVVVVVVLEVVLVAALVAFVEGGDVRVCHVRVRRQLSSPQPIVAIIVKLTRMTLESQIIISS